MILVSRSPQTQRTPNVTTSLAFKQGESALKCVTGSFTGKGTVIALCVPSRRKELISGDLATSKLMSGVSTQTFSILGVSLKQKANVGHALTAIWGIGRAESRKICAKLGLNPFTKLEDLAQDMPMIRAYIEKNYLPAIKAKEEAMKPLRALVKMQCWRGIRAQQGLPCRGQKTRTNARTQKKLAPARARLAGFDFLERQFRKFSTVRAVSSLPSSAELLYHAGARPVLYNSPTALPSLLI
eukprot:g79339.t1